MVDLPSEDYARVAPSLPLGIPLKIGLKFPFKAVPGTRRQRTFREGVMNRDWK